MSALKPAQLNRLGEALERLSADLATQIERGSEEAGPVDLNLPIGRLSRMDAIQQAHMAEATQLALSRRLEAVSAARTRLQKGVYGLCIDCDEPIASARLDAFPEAPFCIDCLNERNAP
jgi:DnaK suppressor protein